MFKLGSLVLLSAGKPLSNLIRNNFFTLYFLLNLLKIVVLIMW